MSNVNATAANFSEMAKVHATCFEAVGQVAALTDPQRLELAEKYAVRSVELLSHAAEKGRYTTLEHIAELRSDDRLTTIQRRDDFKKLLADVEHSIHLVELSDGRRKSSPHNKKAL